MKSTGYMTPEAARARIQAQMTVANRKQKRILERKLTDLDKGKSLRRVKFAADPHKAKSTLTLNEPMPEHAVTSLGLQHWSAWERCKSAEAKWADVQIIVDAINVGLIRTYDGVRTTDGDLKAQAMEVFTEAQESLFALKERYVRLGVVGVDGPVLRDVPAALELWDQILAHSTPNQLLEAQAKQQLMLERRHVFVPSRGREPAGARA